MKANSASWSVLIPIYMENENLSVLVKSLREKLSQQDFKVVFVDMITPNGTTENSRNYRTDTTTSNFWLGRKVGVCQYVNPW